jgi:hypothetical protein
LTTRKTIRGSLASARLIRLSNAYAEEDERDEEAQAALAQALLPRLSPEQVVAIRQVVRQQLLAAFHEEVGQQFKAQLLALTEERDAARNGRARAEQLLTPLLRQRA